MDAVSTPFMKQFNGKRNRKFVTCKCPYCGGLKELRYDVHRSVDSCGCRTGQAISEGRKSHKMSATKEYRAWSSMLSRCQNSNHKSYPSYGGRGIRVCDSWQEFDNFYRDVRSAPSKDYSLERIDNNKGYEPNNVKWATSLDQANNRRSARRYDFQGRCLTVAEWSRLTGIPYNTLLRRFNLQWEIEAALTEPVRDTNFPGMPIKIYSLLRLGAQNDKN